MADTADEAKWQAEFETVGETQLRDGVTGIWLCRRMLSHLAFGKLLIIGRR
jgi:hypothetical protein